MLSTRGNKQHHSWHDPLGWIAGAILLSAIVVPSFVPTTLSFLVSCIVATVTILLLLLPIDRRVVLIAIVFELMVSWCWFVMMDRSSVNVPATTELTGHVVSLTEQKGTNFRVDVLVETSSAPVLIGRTVSILFSDATKLIPGQLVSCRCGPMVFSNQSHDEWLRSLEQNKTMMRSMGSLVLGSTDTSPRWWLLKLRSIIVEQANVLWPSPESSLAAGLIVGSREQFSNALTTAMQRTGTTHLVAVSGANVVVVLWVFGYFLPVKRPWIRAGILGLILAAFVLLTSGTASVTRAGLAAFILLIANGFGRPVNMLRLLLIVAAAIAVLDPLVVRANLGFQLSFLAVFGLMMFSNPLAKLLPLPRLLAVPLAATFSASFCTAPLLASSFGIVSIVSPLTNLVLEAVVNPAMIMAAFTVCVSFIPFVGKFFAWITWPALGFITHTIDLANRVPGAAVQVTLPAWAAWTMVSVIGVFGLWLDFKQRQHGSVEE